MIEVDNFFESDGKFLLLKGDCLEVLQSFPKECLDCVITSPPYWQLREYDLDNESPGNIIGNEDNPSDYVIKIVNIFDEVKRVLKHGGSLWLNLGDKYKDKHLMGMPWRVALAMMDRGWILRNDVIWDKMKGTQSSKDRLRDVYEHIFHFVKSRKYYYDHNSIRIKPIRLPKVYNGELVSATGVSGKKYRKQINESDFLTESEKVEAIKALDATLVDLERGLIVDFRMTIRGNQRTFHSNKVNVSGRAKELDTKGFYILKMGANGHIPSDIWRIVPEDEWRKDIHYAVFPEELLINPINSTCPPGGIVLDPFSGTGSTVLTALKLGRRGIGIDLISKYNKIAEQRIKQIDLDLNLI